MHFSSAGIKVRISLGLRMAQGLEHPALDPSTSSWHLHFLMLVHPLCHSGLLPCCGFQTASDMCWGAEERLLALVLFLCFQNSSWMRQLGQRKTIGASAQPGGERGKEGLGVEVYCLLKQLPETASAPESWLKISDLGDLCNKLDHCHGDCGSLTGTLLSLETQCCI